MHLHLTEVSLKAGNVRTHFSWLSFYQKAPDVTNVSGHSDRNSPKRYTWLHEAPESTYDWLLKATTWINLVLWFLRFHRHWRYPAPLGDFTLCGIPWRSFCITRFKEEGVLKEVKSQDDRPAESPPQHCSTGTVTHWWHPHLQHPLTSSKLQAWWHFLNRKSLENP